MPKKKYPVVTNNKHPFFTYVEMEENKVKICVGNNIVSQLTFVDVKAADEYVNTKSWELIINLASLIAQKTIEQHETK